MNKRTILILGTVVGLVGIAAAAYFVFSVRSAHVEGRPTVIFFHAGG
jgi:uncharacterized membrane protein YedE/YeeE